MSPLSYVLNDQLVRDFLFGGTISPSHTTRFALEKFASRYEQSVETLNKALALSVAFVAIALLPSGESVKIPILDLEVSQRDWFRACPAISYGLQIFTLGSLCWFLLLRRGMTLLQAGVPQSADFGDVSNVLLSGTTAYVWMFFALPRHLPSRLHLIWMLPLIVVLGAAMLSPTFLCAYFVRHLYALHDFVPAITYSALLIPSLALAISLLGVSALAGVREVFPSARRSTHHR
jgi:hypothetical protein